MAAKPIDLEAVRRADAKLKQLLDDHPDLCEPDPKRQQALDDWLRDHTGGDLDHATQADR